LRSEARPSPSSTASPALSGTATTTGGPALRRCSGRRRSCWRISTRSPSTTTSASFPNAIKVGQLGHRGPICRGGSFGGELLGRRDRSQRYCDQQRGGWNFKTNSSLVLHGLESKSKLCLQLPVQGALALDKPEISGVGARDIQNRRIRLRMVEDIRCIHAELQAFGFREPDRFTDVCIKTPTSRPNDRADPEGRHGARLRVLKEDLTGLRIRDRVECAQRL